ncbi:MAG: EpsG family protein [Nanoarchaeota archaeon]
MIDLFSYFIYIFLLIIVLLFTYFGILLDKPNNFSIEFSINKHLNIFHIVALIFITVIVGFRYEVGTDWEVYKDWFAYFKQNPQISFQDQFMEPGYFYINRWFADLGLDYTSVFLLIGFFSWFFIFKSVPNIILPVVLFFLFTDQYFFWSLNGVRQFFAIAVFLFAIKFVISRNFFYYLLFILIGALFHVSILLLIPIYFIPFHKIYNQKIWIIAFTISLFFTQSQFLIIHFQNFIIDAMEQVPVVGKYVKYFETEHYEIQSLKGTGLGFVFRIFVTYFILIFSKKVVASFPKTKIYFGLYFIGAIISNLFFMIQIIGRFNHYLLILRAIVLALIIYKLLKDNKTPALSYGIVGIFCWLYFILFLVDIYRSANLCSPYQFNFTI